MRAFRSGRLIALAALLLLGGSLLAGAALAQGPEQTYSLSWWTVDGGGGSSSGGNYVLDGTAGQPDPGPLLREGGYNLEGGFWGGGLSGVTMFNIYLPLVTRGW